MSRDGSVEESIYVNSAFESLSSTFTFYFCLHFKQEKTHLPPPSFCYILSAHPDLGQIDIIEDDPVAEGAAGDVEGAAGECRQGQLHGGHAVWLGSG